MPKIATRLPPDTLFALGSLSRGHRRGDHLLVNEGRLHWDDTLAMLLPPETRLSADAKKITLLQLVIFGVCTQRGRNIAI